MDIVLITRDRPELTAQTIRSMRENAASWKNHNIVMVFDGTEAECVENFSISGTFLDVPIVITGKQLGVGGAKNFGVDRWYRKGLSGESSGRRENGSHLLMFTDNDMYYLPGWDALLEQSTQFIGVAQIGGWRHPYNQLGRHIGAVHAGGTHRLVHDMSESAVTGNCFVMKWSDWLRYGPFDANAIGPGQSEDFALSRKIVAAKTRIATLEPPVAIHCGLINSAGQPAIGYDEMLLLAREQLERYKPEEVMLATQVMLPPIYSAGAEQAIAEYLAQPRYLNVGSGQRRFDPAHGWANVDCVSRPDQIPDILCDVGRERLPFADGTIELVVLHHVIEHFGLGEADGVIRECWRVLKSGGSLIVTVPDMRKLAARWLGGEIDDYTFMVNAYGAYQGEPGDRHKWGFTQEGLMNHLHALNLVRIEPLRRGETNDIDVEWMAKIIPFDWRSIAGSDIARDWWIAAVEVVKP